MPQLERIAPKVYWVNEETWCCDRHVPPVRYPARLDACYYFGCASVRPPRPEAAPPHPPAVIEERTWTPPEPKVEEDQWEKAKAEADWAIIQVALKEYEASGPCSLPEPEEPPALEPVEPPPVEDFAPGEGPTPQERRQGRTTRVTCKVCGAPLWRRKNEATGRDHFCQVHRGRRG